MPITLIALIAAICLIRSTVATYDVIIVGAGISGLKAAETLYKHDRNIKILILEAQSYIGGRVRTVYDKDLQEAINLGAAYIHGAGFHNFERPVHETYDQDHSQHYLNPLLRYFSNRSLLKVFDLFLPTSGSPTSEYNLLYSKENSEQNTVQFVQATGGKVVAHGNVIDGYNKYCRVLAETAIAAKKEMAKFRLQNIPVGNHTDRLNLKTFFDNTLEKIARKEKWDNRTLNVVKAMSSFASDDMGVSLEEIHPYFWDVEDETFYGGDAQVKDTSKKMNLLVQKLLENMKFDANMATTSTVSENFDGRIQIRLISAAKHIILPRLT